MYSISSTTTATATTTATSEASTVATPTPTTTTAATTTATVTTPIKPSVPSLKIPVNPNVVSNNKSPRMLSPQKILISPGAIPHTLTPRKEKFFPSSQTPTSPKSEKNTRTNSLVSPVASDSARVTTEPVLQVRRLKLVLSTSSQGDKDPDGTTQIKSVRQLSLRDIPEPAQAAALVSLMVDKATTPLLPEHRFGEIGKSDVYINKNDIPSALLPLCPSKAGAKLMLHHLLHQLFLPAIKTSQAWHKAIESQKSLLKNAPQNFSFGSEETEKEIQLKSMMEPFARDMATALFGSSGKIAQLKLPAKLIQFLKEADHQFFSRYLDGTSMRINKINEARLTFLKNILVTRLLAPMLNSLDSTRPTVVEAWFQGKKLSALIEAFKNISQDFFDQSYASMPNSLKEKVAKRVKEELAQEELVKKELAKEESAKEELARKNKADSISSNRIAHFRSRSSNNSPRHVDEKTDSLKNDSTSKKSNNLFEIKTRKKILQKKNSVLIEQIATSLNLISLDKEFQDALLVEKKIWASSDVELTKEEIRKIIFEFVNLFIYTKNHEEKSVEQSLLDFSKNIEEIVEKDFSELTKNRATMMLMPKFLDDLESLMQTTLALDDESLSSPSSSSVQVSQDTPQPQTTASTQTSSTSTTSTVANNT